MKGSISGKRLAIAREMKKFTWQELADAFTEKATEEESRDVSFEVSKIQKWQNRGIPRKWLFFVSNFFKVDELAFTDKRLSEQEFKKLIFDPTTPLPKTPSDIVGEPEQLVKPSVAKEIVPENNRIPVSESKFPNEAKKKELFAQLTKLVDKGDYNEANRLIDTLPDNESRLVMLNRLIEHFPDNAHLLADLAIHYGKLKQTELAIKAADLAIKISPTANEFLYYVKGRCLCLAAYDLMDEIRDCDDLTPYKMAKIKELVVQAGKQFEDCRRTETKSDHGYIVHIEMIIKAFDFGYRTSGKSKISGFLMKDEAESAWYIGLLLLANNLYDELKSLHGREEGTPFINKLSELDERLHSFTEALLMDSSQLPVLL